MSDRKINARILGKIIENSIKDEILKDFLVNLIYTETDNSKGWHWRSEYKSCVDESIKKMEKIQ